MLADGQPPFPVEGQAVGAWLGVLTDVETVVSAFRPEDIHRAVGGPTVDDVGIGRTEKQIALAGPNWAFGENKIARHLFQLDTRRHDGIQCCIASDDLKGYLPANLGAVGSVEI